MVEHGIRHGLMLQSGFRLHKKLGGLGMMPRQVLPMKGDLQRGPWHRMQVPTAIHRGIHENSSWLGMINIQNIFHEVRKPRISL